MAGVFPFDYKDGQLIWSERGVGRTLGKRAGSVDKSGYRRVRYKGKYTLEHRTIWEMFNGPIPEGMEVDHINRDNSDNRIENLRVVTPEENKRNVLGGPTYEDGRWRVRIRIGGKYPSQGSYSCWGKAWKRYLEVKKEYHGVEI